MKNLLLITSDKVGDTGTVSFGYIFQDESLDAFDNYPAQCRGPFGHVKEMDKCLHFNIFDAGDGFKMGGPVDNRYDDFFESVPENFSMLCTGEIAEKVKAVWGDKMNIDIIKSELTLLTN